MIASHVIFTMYGFWLPNDPRGSRSSYVGSRDLYHVAGPVTKVDTSTSVAGVKHDVVARLAAIASLKHRPVQFTGLQARSAVLGIVEYAKKAGVVVHAFAIMPDHVHAVIAAHRLGPSSIVTQFKGAATKRLLSDGLHPGQPKCFARGEWVVYLDTDEDVLRSIRYVEDNPVKQGLPRQSWQFVTPYG